MQRTLNPSTRSVLFHRDELDGKQHSNWLLHVRVDEEKNTQCLVTLELEYSGKFWSKTLENILDSEKDRRPDQPGSSCRRNTLNLTKSSFNRIVRKDLGWKPYKIIRRQKITPANAVMRLQMARYLVSLSVMRPGSPSGAMS